ncbi:ATP-binding protein [Pelagibacteraceae bacterium]|nr:ATP-binding protein [Pelagibacteraceae bacterium]
MQNDISKILDKLPFACISIAKNKKILYFNYEAKKKFIFLKENIKIDNIIESEELNEKIDNSFATNKENNINFTPLNFQDSFFDANMVFLENDKKELTIFFTDESLKRGYEKMRTDFIANVSHELRTPLSSIIASVETIQNNANNDKTAQIKFLESMGKQAWRMSRLVEDLLTLSKIESDDKELHFESINVADLVQGVVDNLYNKADKKNIKIRIIKNTDKLNVKADYDAMMQVFINLLDNAINYSKENSNITINFDEETNNDKLYLKISITDEGDGIEKKYINRITQRFYRVDKNRSRMQGGTGLGLAIVKHIIQRHQGELEIKSKVGIGSTFSALFPSQENIKIL